MNEQQITPGTTDADITEPVETVTPPPADDFLSMLDNAGFDEEAAEEIQRTTVADSTVVAGIQTDLRPDELGQRVALYVSVMDDTQSMDKIVPATGRSLMNMALLAHDKALDTVTKVTSAEPVDVLASGVWLNGQPPVIYPYTRIEQAPRFGDTSVPTYGMTAWRDRFAEVLAGTAKQVGELEDHNKTVYGMCGLVTDGFDNASREHSPESLAKIVRGFRRMRTFVPFAMYVGAMPTEGSYDYVEERNSALRRLQYMGVDDIELETANLETIVRRMFTECGFDPAMVFLPGDDPRQIVQAFVTVSKLMASVSKGAMPDGLSDI